MAFLLRTVYSLYWPVYWVSVKESRICFTFNRTGVVASKRGLSWQWLALDDGHLGVSISILNTDVYKGHSDGSIIPLKSLRSAAGTLPVSMHCPPASDPRAHSPRKCPQGRQWSLAVSMHSVLSSILPLSAPHHPPLCAQTLLALLYFEPNSALGLLSSEEETHLLKEVRAFLSTSSCFSLVLPVWLWSSSFCL